LALNRVVFTGVYICVVETTQVVRSEACGQTSKVVLGGPEGEF
jgi:hypothetical protein